MEEVFSEPPPEVPGYPSLYQDILKGRRTEIEFLNGYVVKKGNEVGVRTPYSEAAVAVIKGVESGEFKVGMDNVRRVEEIANT